MAGKFRIFCDDCPPRANTFEPEEKQAPPLPQQHHAAAALAAIAQQQQQVATKIAAANSIGPSSTGSSNSNNTSTINNLDQHDKFTTLEQASVPVAPNHGPLVRQPLGIRREPLGLRQASSQPQVEISQANSITQASSQQSVLGDEDRENDISMASLGSDYVPSISQGDEELNSGLESSFEVDDSQQSFSRDFECDESALIDYDDDNDDPHLEDDDELQKELARAFKQHDDSQLFKSTVYIDDIETYLKHLERIPDLRPIPNYMDYQNDIDSQKRTILINWLVEVADEYRLQSETLFICVNIIDRFLSKHTVSTPSFQLLGVAAMFIASKYEEIYPPELNQFVEVTDETCSGKEICQMEQNILKTLNFRISQPSITFFLNQIFAFNKFTKRVYHLAEYLCYLSLLADKPFLEYYPSEIALAAVILAAQQLDGSANISPELRVAYDKSNIDQLNRRNTPRGVKARDVDRRKYTINKQLPFCIESLRELQLCAYNRSSPLNGDSAVVTRFSEESRHCVATLPPPNIEDLYLY